MIAAGQDFILAPSPQGLRVLGRNEESLQPPAAVLREIYGERLVARPPQVRLMDGSVVQQPVMHVRISAETRHMDAIKRAMAMRGVHAVEEYVRPHYCVLRYQAPLADLLGLPAELAKLTDGNARHWIVLSPITQRCHRRRAPRRHESAYSGLVLPHESSSGEVYGLPERRSDFDA